MLGQVHLQSSTFKERIVRNAEKSLLAPSHIPHSQSVDTAKHSLITVVFSIAFELLPALCLFYAYTKTGVVEERISNRHWRQTRIVMMIMIDNRGITCCLGVSRPLYRLWLLARAESDNSRHYLLHRIPLIIMTKGN